MINNFLRKLGIAMPKQKKSTAKTPAKPVNTKQIPAATNKIQQTTLKPTGHQVKRDKAIGITVDDSPSVVAKELAAILQFKRPHGSDGEKAFCEGLQTTLSKLKRPSDTLMIDAFGNIHVEILPADTKTKNTTLFSCHVDTVHNTDGVQTVLFDPVRNELFIDDNPDNNCLGGDDGVGILILTHMIKAHVPGYYIFHRAEEIGGQGSSWIAENLATKLLHIKRAIAFDRKGTSDVINYQRGKCASDEFCKALAEALNAADASFKYKPGRGVFTDTANYIRLIPECSNISVGYYAQHTKNEYVDIEHVEKLLKVVLLIDWDALPAVRDPKEIPSYNTSFHGTNWNKTHKTHKTPDTTTHNKKKTKDLLTALDARFLIARHPSIAAQLLIDAEIEWDEVDALLEEQYIDRAFVGLDDTNNDTEDFLDPSDPDYFVPGIDWNRFK